MPTVAKQAVDVDVIEMVNKKNMGPGFVNLNLFQDLIWLLITHIMRFRNKFGMTYTRKILQITSFNF